MGGGGGDLNCLLFARLRMLAVVLSIGTGSMFLVPAFIYSKF
jgi:hypothetical protein